MASQNQPPILYDCYAVQPVDIVHEPPILQKLVVSQDPTPTEKLLISLQNIINQYSLRLNEVTKVDVSDNFDTLQDLCLSVERLQTEAQSSLDKRKADVKTVNRQHAACVTVLHDTIKSFRPASDVSPITRNIADCSKEIQAHLSTLTYAITDLKDHVDQLNSDLDRLRSREQQACLHRNRNIELTDKVVRLGLEAAELKGTKSDLYLQLQTSRNSGTVAPAAATRSKKAVKRVTPASKVTKKTSNAANKANKAPKAKKAPKATKAKTPPPREDILVHDTSSGTMSPDQVDETPPPTIKVDLQELIAQLSKVQEERNNRHPHEGRVHKSRRHHRRHSRSHRHRHSNTSNSDLFDSKSDWEERRGVPFRYIEDKKPFLSIAKRFRSVNVKYFKQIFFGTFKTKNFAKLAHIYTTPAKEDKDVNGHNHMMHCFHVYSVAAGRFAHVSVKEGLNEALHAYAIRLLRLPITYRFNSILAYHLAFVTARIQGD
ncbi:hypothetical protein HO133_010251 [Letharia lupina]|uniref:Uncharacterized protein n=1 Tax=Letharia lupina TaxID=560253 RepID=A0A8H6CKU8_9LECA|nr:uncharacterized protein HO133_010251 [Letharia lupina]KAF6225056.1 hypothetical protein HO133_010251 [Letharia lupina]